MIVINGYIIATTSDDEQYIAIMHTIQTKPEDPDGFQYKLRADNLEWELVELPEPEPVDEDAGPEDYEQALEEMGVDFSD